MSLYTLSASLKVSFLFVFKLFPHLGTFLFPCHQEERHFSTFDTGVLVTKVEPMVILRLRTSRVRVRGHDLFKYFFLPHLICVIERNKSP
jgi:hypothetical protein